MSATPFTIYKSSAGSGKTYTLTTEYLKIALRSQATFRHILAVTFTNKATQEMKERILHELTRLTQHVDQTHTMDKEVLSHLGLTENELKTRASQTLSAILHDFSSFSVSTIDSFFQRIIRSFAKEIDLQAKFDVELDQDGVLARLVDRLVMKVSESPFLHKWLIDYSISQIQEGNSWDVRRNVTQLGSQLFQEAFKQNRFLIREFLSNEENLSTFKAEIFEQRQNLIEEASSLNRKAEAIREKYNLEWSDFKNGSRSFAFKFGKLGDPSSPFPELSDGQRGLEDRRDDWFSKTSKKADVILAAADAGLADIWSKMLPGSKAWKTNQAVRSNLDVFGLFHFLLEELSLLKEEEDILLISDINDFLREITAGNDAPFIYEKVGNRFQNFLIDEFQDTSGFQWESFRPLLLDSLAQGYPNLLVGDVKQSIYRWRGGELRLLLEKVEREVAHFGVTVKNLDTNYRSLSNLINFNNSLFSVLPERMVDILSKNYEVNDAQILLTAYEGASQKVPSHKFNASFKGCVRLEFLDPRDEEQKFEEAVLKKIPKMVMHLQDLGYRPKDIAFLTRTKKDGVKIADCLVSYGITHPENGYSFDVVSDEALLVSHSAAVSCLVAALRHLADGEDVQLKTMAYHWAVFSGYEIDHTVFEPNAQFPQLTDLLERFSVLKRELVEKQLLDIVETLIGFLGLQVEGKELAYVAAFKDVIYGYVSQNRADLHGLLDWWETEKKKRTVKIPEDHDAMRILTIHKSKGLQFKVVLIPFFDWQIFDTRKKPIVWTSYFSLKLNKEIVVPLTMGASLMHSDFKPVYQQEAMMAFLDTLNLAYVAITRAEEVFWSCTPQTIFSDPSYSTFGANLEMLLRHSNLISPLNIEEQDEEASGFTFQYGEWPTARRQEEEVSLPQRLRWTAQDWGRLLKVKSTSVGFSEEELELRRKGQFGTLIHGILEKAKTEEELFIGIEALLFEGSIDEEERSFLSDRIKQLMSSPHFKRWFSPEVEVFTEQGILLPDGSSRRPDRVVIDNRGVEVIDFKTGVDQKIHITQVQRYVRLVAELVDLPVRGYLCYIDSTEIKEVSV